MSKDQIPSAEALSESIRACLANGEKLYDESHDLEFRDPPSLQLYLLLIAQEEFAKAFLLFLVRDGIIPFSGPLLRAMNDHACKHLVGLIMDYVIMNWETMTEAEEMIRVDSELADRLPAVVESAIMLLRFEKVGRWESRAWDWEEPPTYDKGAKKIAEGSADRRKHDALYVRIGGDGRVCPAPPITLAQIGKDKERLRSFRYFMRSLSNPAEPFAFKPSYRYEKAVALIRAMFDQRV